MTYRKLKQELNALFDNIDFSDMDNQVVPEDYQAIIDLVEKQRI